MSSSIVNPETLAALLRGFADVALVAIEPVQTLWGGYGQLIRCRLEGVGPSSVIVKHVRWPTENNHPRGWNSNRSHQRKVRSYEVESEWYRQYAASCTIACRVPRCLTLQRHGDEVFIVLEDLDAAGFDARRHSLTDGGNDASLWACVEWLATFHATFLGVQPAGLWPVGTYWHLATRPDELEVLEDKRLKGAAKDIDRQLSGARFQTFVHGDAKLANFCFSRDGRDVAAVDFQYVGGGCGMKDLAYFVSSCLDEETAEKREGEILDRYFDALGGALSNANSSIDGTAVASDWRPLYPVAWTDFVRFLKGWSPGHWKLHRYSQRLAREVVEAL